MLNSKFFKTIIISLISVTLVIGLNFSNSTIIKAQDSSDSKDTANLTTLQEHLKSLQQSNNEFNNKIEKLKELFNEKSEENQKLPSDQLSAGISSDKENQTFTGVYTSFEELGKQRDELAKKFTEIENKQTSLSQDDKDKFNKLKTQLEKTKTQTSNPDAKVAIFSKPIDQFGIIIKPLDNGKLEAQELCKIQETLEVVKNENLTKTFTANTSNSCGYFLAKTNEAFQGKLAKEAQILQQGIDNSLNVFEGTKPEPPVIPTGKETKGFNWISWLLLPFITFLLGGFLGFTIPKLRQTGLTQPDNQNTNIIENTIQYQLTQLKNDVGVLKNDTSYIKQKVNSQLANESQGFNQQDQQRIQELNRENQKLQRRIQELEATMKDPNPPLPLQFGQQEKTQSFPSLPSDEQDEQAVSLTKETIDKIWKGETNSIEFESNESGGEYLVNRGDVEGNYLSVNRASTINDQSIGIWRKGKIFSVEGNTDSLKIEKIEPARVVKSGNSWKLVKPGKVWFS